MLRRETGRDRERQGMNFRDELESSLSLIFVWASLRFYLTFASHYTTVLLKETRPSTTHYSLLPPFPPFMGETEQSFDPQNIYLPFFLQNKLWMSSSQCDFDIHHHPAGAISIEPHYQQKRKGINYSIGRSTWMPRGMDPVSLSSTTWKSC